MRVTISLPCYGRPQRTIRAIENICNQNINGWEALVVGDACWSLSSFAESQHCKDLVSHSELNGNKLSISNLRDNKGGCGYYIINENIKNAQGEYFLFFGNDDVILPNHFENYLAGIEGTDYDFVYYNTYLDPLKKERNSELRSGMIGHSEIIVKTDFLRKMPPHGFDYGHDFVLIRNMATHDGAKYRKFANSKYTPTYIVKGLGDLRYDTID